MTTNSKDTDNLQGSVIINTQYIKDLSFENPRAPYSLMENEKPSINIDLDVKADHMNDDMFEVVISVSIGATNDSTTFVIDLSYAGLFTLTGVQDQSSKEVILLVHCPNILFPYVRRMISDITRDGGFPPLMLSPVDFMGLYYARKNETYNEPN